MELIQSIHETRQILTLLQYQQWRGVLFSIQWWSLLSLLIVSWIVWWRLVNKSMIFEVLSYSLFIVIIGTTLDTYGQSLGFWAYPIKIFYLNPGAIAGDWGMPPVVKSLIYQYFPGWKEFIIAQIIVAAFFAFIGEPILVWMGVYKMYGWSYLKSFFVYIPVAIFTKWVVDELKRKVICSVR